MALVKVVTRKEVDFHNRVEEFSNVYYFGDGDLTNPTAGEVTDLLNKVIAQEKTICSANIRFLGALGYTGWDTIGDTPPLASVELIGATNPGTATGTACYRECAIDMKWILGAKRHLRTMMHTGITNGLDASGAGSPGTPSTALQTFANNMLGATHYSPFRRMAPNGDVPGAVLINPYLEHRQFHRYRRRTD